MATHWKRGKDAEKLKRYKNRDIQERLNKGWIDSDKFHQSLSVCIILRSSSQKNDSCNSGYLLQEKQFIMSYHRKPQYVLFYIQKVSQYEKWSSFMYCCSKTWNSNYLWGTKLQKEHINGILLLFEIWYNLITKSVNWHKYVCYLKCLCSVMASWIWASIQVRWIFHPLLFVVVILLQFAPEINLVLHLKLHGYKHTNKMRLTSAGCCFWRG